MEICSEPRQGIIFYYSESFGENQESNFILIKLRALLQPDVSLIKSHVSTSNGSMTAFKIGLFEVDSNCWPRVHHLHGVPLPEEHLLDGRVARDSLWVHRDHDVDGEPGKSVDVGQLVSMTRFSWYLLSAYKNGVTPEGSGPLVGPDRVWAHGGALGTKGRNQSRLNRLSMSPTSRLCLRFFVELNVSPAWPNTAGSPFLYLRHRQERKKCITWNFDQDPTRHNSWYQLMVTVGPDWCELVLLASSCRGVYWYELVAIVLSSDLKCYPIAQLVLPCCHTGSTCSKLLSTCSDSYQMYF